MLIPKKFVTNFFISYLIIAHVASNCRFFNRFAAKVHRLLLAPSCFSSSSSYTYSQDGDFSFSVFSSPWPPSLRLILSRCLSDRAHEKRIVLRRCPLNSSCQSRLLPVSLFQPLHATLQVPSSSRSPSRSNCRKPPGISPALAGLPFHACRLSIFYSSLGSSASQTLFHGFFSRLISLVTCRVTFFRDRDNDTRDFPSFNSKTSSLDFLHVSFFYSSIFFISCRREQETPRRVYLLGARLPRERLKDILLSTLSARCVTTFAAKSTKLDDLLFFHVLSKASTVLCWSLLDDLYN